MAMEKSHVGTVMAFALIAWVVAIAIYIVSFGTTMAPTDGPRRPPTT